jgi:hypothetical protein
MADTFYVRQNDNKITISGTCLDANGAAVSLTGATLKLQVRQQFATTAILNATATADPDQTANKGKWSYSLLAADLASADTYQASIQATYGDGTIITFPSNQDLNPASIVIDTELA